MTLEEAMQSVLTYCVEECGEINTCKGKNLNCVEAVVIQALEKQIPKKIIKEEYMYGFNVKCTNGHNIPTVCGYGNMPYCPFCGQKLNWRD